MTQTHKEIEVRFLAGARNHSKMREDLRLGITTLVALYSGALDEVLRNCRSNKHGFSNEFGPWSVSGISGRDLWWAILWNGHEVFLSKKVFGLEGYNEPARAFIAEMHQEFGQLVEGLMKIFPDHCVQISHIFDAADAF